MKIIINGIGDRANVGTYFLINFIYSTSPCFGAFVVPVTVRMFLCVMFGYLHIRVGFRCWSRSIHGHDCCYL